ncbi:MAG: hypothetical protein E7351_00730 [Clostridiales bacterium]|nr:hypothetical protein [Clostridiales bacterium]
MKVINMKDGIERKEILDNDCILFGNDGTNKFEILKKGSFVNAVYDYDIDVELKKDVDIETKLQIRNIIGAHFTQFGEKGIGSYKVYLSLLHDPYRNFEIVDAKINKITKRFNHNVFYSKMMELHGEESTFLPEDNCD